MYQWARKIVIAQKYIGRHPYHGVLRLIALAPKVQVMFNCVVASFIDCREDN